MELQLRRGDVSAPMIQKEHSPDSGSNGKRPTISDSDTIVIEARAGYVTKAQGLWLPDDQVRANKLRSVLSLLFPAYTPVLSRLLGRATTASLAGEKAAGKLLLHDHASGRDWLLDLVARPERQGSSVEPQITIKLQSLAPRAVDDLLASGSRWLLEKYGEGLKLRFWSSDRDHRFTVVTDAPGQQTLTPDPSSMIGRTRWECAGLTEISDNLAWQHHLFQLENGQNVVDFVYTATGPTGEQTTWSVGATPRRSSSGEIEGYQGYALDVSELSHARRALNHSRASLHALIEQLPVPAAIWTHDWRVQMVNRSAAELTEIPNEVWVGLDYQQACALLEITTIANSSETLPQLTGVGLLLQRRTKSGEIRSWWQTVVAENEQGDKICIYVDVTSKGDQIANGKHRERLKQFGRFASSVAHDLSNLVAVVSSGIRTIRDGKIDEVEEAIDDIETMLDTSRDMIQSLRAVANGVVKQPCTDIDVSAELKQIIRSFNRSDARPIEFLGAGVRAQAHVDPTSFNRAVLNVLVNAREACGNDGRVAVTLGPAEDADASLSITVEDDGPGWPVDLKQILGDPMISTKGSTRGFGLAQVAEFTQAHGGEVAFSRSRWEGAKVSITLAGTIDGSAADVEASAGSQSDLPPTPKATAKTPAVEKPRPRVLIVDDHQAVRRMVARAFKAIGWETVQTESGQAALEWIDSSTGSLPDLILSDVVMPGMSGKELAATVKDRFPGLPFAIMSGHVPGRDLAEIPFLPKPFEPEDLVLLLRKLELPQADAASVGSQP